MPLEPQIYVCGDDPSEVGRLDKFLKLRLTEASRSQIQRWIHMGAIRINGLSGKKNTVVQPGDSVEILIPENIQVLGAEPEDIPLSIVFEDEYLVVVDKPKGMVTHPGNGVRTGTLANALAHRYGTLSDSGGPERPGIVHRLDRDTSGLLVVARDNATHAQLAQQLTDRNISRIYQAICWREPSEAEGVYTWPIGRHPTDPLRRAVREDGKYATTHYRVLSWYQCAAHVEVRLDTGRTHQIRVHFSKAGLPIAGDPLYGGRENMASRMPPLLQVAASGLLKRLSSQALHAAKLSFNHPITQKRLEFESALPEEFQAALEFLKPYCRPNP